MLYYIKRVVAVPVILAGGYVVFQAARMAFFMSSMLVFDIAMSHHMHKTKDIRQKEFEEEQLETKLINKNLLDYEESCPADVCLYTKFIEDKKNNNLPYGVDRVLSFRFATTILKDRLDEIMKKKLEHELVKK